MHSGNLDMFLRSVKAGESIWRFESIDDPSIISNTDYRIFWYSQYLNTIVWVLIALLNIFYIDRLLLIAVALTLAVSNIIGYWKCSRGTC